ncbi:MAG: hypothetical protein EOO12_10035 [Chitinophagaceae bacterium]|nr:MAG: hypothetical protein EOO12_10035 [Chitinophagaceae bacterium]
MDQLPAYLPAVFLLIVFATAFALAHAASFHRAVLIGMAAWLTLQFLLSLNGFYVRFKTVPPRMLLLVLPPLVLLVTLLATKRGRRFLDRLDPGTLTLLHTVRLPVEFVLWALSLQRVIPTLLTFEGSNLDVLSGLTAPVIYYFTFVKTTIGRFGLLLWNFICLGLLVNVVYHAFLSAPTVLQRFAFDQPAVAIGYFPFTLLPGFVVPIVLLSHAAMIRRLLQREKTQESTALTVSS